MMNCLDCLLNKCDTAFSNFFFSFFFRVERRGLASVRVTSSCVIFPGCNTARTLCLVCKLKVREIRHRPDGFHVLGLCGISLLDYFREYRVLHDSNDRDILPTHSNEMLLYHCPFVYTLVFIRRLGC